MRKSNVQTLLDRISSMNGTADGNSYESIGTFRQFIGSLEQQPSSDARHNRVALLVSGELSQLGINIRRGNQHQANVFQSTASTIRLAWPVSFD